MKLVSRQFSEHIENIAHRIVSHRTSSCMCVSAGMESNNTPDNTTTVNAGSQIRSELPN